jgi:hypothetical protein
MRPLTGITWLWFVPQVPGRIVVAAQRSPRRERRVPLRAARSVRPAREPRERRIVGRDVAGARAELDRHVAEREPGFDRERARDRARILHREAASAVDAEPADQVERHVLRADARRERAVEHDAHQLGFAQREHLGREHVFEFARAAGERDRAERADRARVAVGAGVRGARQHDAEFGRDDVADALLGIAHVEEMEAVALRRRAHRLRERRRVRIGRLGAARHGRERVIEHAERQVGTTQRAPGRRESREGMRSVQLVQHVAVHVDQLATVGAPAGDVRVPHFVEERPRTHRWCNRASSASSALPMVTATAKSTTVRAITPAPS